MTASQIAGLENGFAHVWLVDLGQPLDAIPSLYAMLSRGEQGRAAKYRFAKDRVRFIVSHAALRSVLGSYLQRAPQAVEFLFDEAGKPGVASELELSFSLSHSHSLAAIAVAFQRRVGVDIEYAGRERKRLQILHRFLTVDEQRQLAAMPPDERGRGLLKCWVCKEASFKARGEGRLVPLDAFSVDLAVDSPRPLQPTSGEADAAWYAHPLAIHADYVGALVTEGGPVDVAYRRWVSGCWGA